MRHRVFDDTILYGEIRHYHRGVLTGTTGQNYYSRVDFMDDVVTPNFKKRIDAGEIINNPFSHYQRLSSAGGGSWSAVSTTDPTDVYSAECDASLTRFEESYFLPNYGWHDGAIQSEIDESMQIAKFNAISRMDKTPYAFFEDIFEIRKTFQTISGVLSSAMRPAQAYAKARDKYIRQGVPPAQAAADAWLGVKYGLKPPVISIMNLLESLDRDFTRPPRQRAIGQDVVSKTSSGTATPATATFPWSQTTKNSSRAGILYQVTNPVIDTNYIYGLRAKDVPKGIWAVMPYSWVIDRFLDVGGAISAFMNLSDPSLKILAAWEGRLYEDDKSHQYTGHTQPGFTITASGDVVRDLTKIKYRTPWVPSYSDIVPTFRIDTDLQHTGDLLALLVQRLGR